MKLAHAYPVKPAQAYFGLAALIAGALATGPALAVDVYSSTHLNLRTGPGIQYPVIGVMDRNVPANADGCLADWSWCSVTVAGVTGWSAAKYLLINQGGRVENLEINGKNLGVPIVQAAGFEEIVAAPTVGVVVAPAAHVEAIVPTPDVVAFIAQPAAAAVHVDGEIVVGSVLPAAVTLYAVPSSPYSYAVVNGLTVLVEPTARTIVYIHRV